MKARMVSGALLAIATIVVESVLIGRVDSRDVSMALLAGGGAHAYRTLLLAGVVLAVRLFARILLPGAVVYSAGQVVVDTVRAVKARAAVR